MLCDIILSLVLLLSAQNAKNQDKQKNLLRKYLFELFADNLQKIDANLTVSSFMSIMVS